MATSKTIVVAPLDWGLGHATRCVPVIRQLLSRRYDVLIVAEGEGRKFLETEFPRLEIISFPGYEISYPGKGQSMAAKMIGSVPGIIRGIKKEHEMLDLLIREKKPAAVISDNRFGMWSAEILSIFITHQVSIKAPFGESLLGLMNRKYIKKFNFCWIPDYPGEENLSGELGHTFRMPLHCSYIGPLSRFGFEAGQTDAAAYENDILMMLSGPEPQRTLFEDILLKESQRLLSLEPELKFTLVRGKPGESGISAKNGIRIFDHLPDRELRALISKSKLVIARSGYSTIMDLERIGGRAAFVPTPGQTEQEYLAERFLQKGVALMMKQGKVDLEYALKTTGDYKGFPGRSSSGLLDSALDELDRFLQGKGKY